MSLSNQVHLYSVDTSYFYNNEEKKIHDELNNLYLERKPAVDKIKKLELKIHKIKEKIKNNKNNTEELTLKIKELNSTISEIKVVTKELNKKIKSKKNELLHVLSESNGEIRFLNDELLNDRLIVSSFESTLTRVIGAKTNELTTDIVIVQTYFFGILEDLIKNGFYWNGEKYKCFTASAGQIRTKKTVFIKESVWNKHSLTLMCGLTLDVINNEYNGMNINKFLAYLALNNSATELWEDFDIDSCIVVNDFESKIKSEVDYIDRDSYVISRREMDVEINHTDGSGMILPSLSKKSFMTRLPFVKGLLISSPFDKFIRQHNRNNKDKIGKIVDIYGKEYDILNDKISVIFTKSQFKMWKYYKNPVEVEDGLVLSGWDLYKYYFKKYNCQAGITNTEPDKFTNATLNYQMIQTLTDMSDEELEYLTSQSKSKIDNISKDKNTMLTVMGAIKSNENKNYYQKSLEIYPELLADTYSKEILKGLKKKIVNNCKHGKIDIKSTYTYICPDMYAFCEYLFKGDTNPKGLLANGEVYCSLYKNTEKLDCLRSPHLYREHAVRKNVVDDYKKSWFTTNGLYISVHDPISRILQCDFDGDKSLVVADEKFVEIAERNMEGVVPLYYEMESANQELITPNNIYQGLKLAYTGGNIGVISNEISKIWNNENIDLEVIKLLCMENNYIIDFAKTLFKPKRPEEINERIKKYTNNKVPNFFIYAKDKTEIQVESVNDSTVNRLRHMIKNPIMNFKKAKLGEFDYEMLMSNPKVELDYTIIEKYTELDLSKRFIINGDVDDVNSSSNLYVYKKIKDELLLINSDIHLIVDVLIKYLYLHKNSSYKTTLWSSFGDIIYANLNENIENKFKNTLQCDNCGIRIIKTNNKIKYCKDCSIEIDNKNRKNRK